MNKESLLTFIPSFDSTEMVFYSVMRKGYPINSIKINNYNNTINFMRFFFLLFLSLLSPFYISAAELLVEAESFPQKGGWVVDQQFMDLMGSPYLIAHGMGVPVADASQSVTFPKKGNFYVYVRTYNWTSPWFLGKGPGQFKLTVGNKRLSTVAGVQGTRWEWQYLGKVNIRNKQVVISLNDLTGFDGRCDAIYFSTNKQAPPSDMALLYKFRRRLLNISNVSRRNEHFDFVVCGGGLAGMCAAMAAARQGLKVALINDRPVLGGNNSSEIRVHLGGRIELSPYKELGNMVKEFGPVKWGNAQPAGNYMDEKKKEWIDSEPNISLFSNCRVIALQKKGNSIQSVLAKHIETGEEILFTSPLFSDCTGDGTVGALAGADYMMGREAKSEYGELRAPEVADKLTMGSSVQWHSIEGKQPEAFPLFEYGMIFNEESKNAITMGDWTWETGMNFDQIKDFEYIRDYGLMVVYSNWSYLKNKSIEKIKFQKRKLDWVAYIAGKRESRRLIGDYVLTGNDLMQYKIYPDGTASTSWSIDLHSADSINSKFFPGKEFLSIAVHTPIYPYPVPYRCLYSRNVDNLYMAGRNISVTHVALGTIRVMRTTAMLGEVVGLAASLCNKNQVKPRDVYQAHFSELIELMKKGAGKHGLENNQLYNEGNCLWEKPQIVN